MRFRAAKLVIIVAVALPGFVYPRLASTVAGTSAAPGPQHLSQARGRPGPAGAATRRARRDYSKFSHDVPQHRQQACDSCHKFPSPNWQEAREEADAFPDVTQYPEHASCLGCHRQQFFARERPAPSICSVCHQSAVPNKIALHPFPNPPEVFDRSPKGKDAVSEFGVYFPHDKHLGLFGSYDPDSEAGGGANFVKASLSRAARQDDPAAANEACSTCHQTYMPQGDSDEEYVTKPPAGLAEGAFWLKKGMFKTTPAGHAICATCHSADAGLPPAPDDCAACHKILPPEDRPQLAVARGDYDRKLASAMGVSDKKTLLKWSRRHAARFRHEWPPHDLACTSCHNVTAMNTADKREKRVLVVSCGGGGTGCHTEPTQDGVLNTELAQKRADPKFECTKCHITNGRRPAPETHSDAVAATSK